MEIRKQNILLFYLVNIILLESLYLFICIVVMEENELAEEKLIFIL